MLGIHTFDLIHIDTLTFLGNTVVFVFICIYFMLAKGPLGIASLGVVAG